MNGALFAMHCLSVRMPPSDKGMFANSNRGIPTTVTDMGKASAVVKSLLS